MAAQVLKEKESNKPIEPVDLNILVDMTDLRIFVSLKADTTMMKKYRDAQKDRFKTLRHIRVNEDGVRFAKENGEIIE